jgi:hypothetical protein
MQPEGKFLGLPRPFWAYVRTISQQAKYASAKRGVHTYTPAEIRTALLALGLNTDELFDGTQTTPLADLLLDYFEHRADVLNNQVKDYLMDAPEARALFDQTYNDLQPTCPLPLNKQKGEKAGYSALTGLVNMLIEHYSGGHECDYDPRRLTAITREGRPLRTLARRVDGAFPAAVDPVAVWEIKEYYFTTTFGSRIADGVYETLLDGMELEELREHEGVDVLHYLMVDSYNTWWNMGRSYLCRMIDITHMGYVDEVLFGREVFDRLPELVPEWVARAEAQATLAPPELPGGQLFR